MRERVVNGSKRRRLMVVGVILALTGCREDRISLWSTTAGFASGRDGGTVTIGWEEFPAGGSTTEVVEAVNTAVGRSLLVVAETPSIWFAPHAPLVDPRTGTPTIGGAIAAPSNFAGPYESCAVFYDPRPRSGFTWRNALHEVMHCLGFNDVTNFENADFQRCDADPDLDDDGHGDFHYMPDQSIMSYCNNPGRLTEADIRGLQAAGY